MEKRYGKYNLSDPFLALQRDSEALGGQSPGVHQASACSSPLAVLKQVVTHCRRMQEKMLAQLAAADSSHKRVGLGVVAGPWMPPAPLLIRLMISYTCLLPKGVCSTRVVVFR